MENTTNEDDENSEEDQREFVAADVEEVEDNLMRVSAVNQRTLST